MEKQLLGELSKEIGDDINYTIFSVDYKKYGFDSEMKFIDAMEKFKNNGSIEYGVQFKNKGHSRIFCGVRVKI